MNEALPTFVGFLVLLYYAVALVIIVWGFYIAYLLTRALRKYLRT